MRMRDTELQKKTLFFHMTLLQFPDGARSTMLGECVSPQIWESRESGRETRPAGIHQALELATEEATVQI